MSAARIEHDERSISLENAGYRWSWLVLAYGLLITIAIRSFANGEQPWDLFALLIISGGVHAAWQARHRTATGRTAFFAALTLVVAAVVGLALVVFGR